MPELIDAHGYCRDTKTREKIHRDIMKPILLDALEELFPKENWIVHHRDGDKQNNDLFNLEVMTQPKHGKLHNIGTQRGKFRGTYYTRKRDPWLKVWQSRIWYNGKNRSLGMFNDPVSSEIVYDLVWSEIHETAL